MSPGGQFRMSLDTYSPLWCFGHWGATTCNDYLRIALSISSQYHPYG